jgi:hypothetical protein
MNSAFRRWNLVSQNSIPFFFVFLVILVNFLFRPFYIALHSIDKKNIVCEGQRLVVCKMGLGGLLKQSVFYGSFCCLALFGALEGTFYKS